MSAFNFASSVKVTAALAVLGTGEIATTQQALLQQFIVAGGNGSGGGGGIPADAYATPDGLSYYVTPDGSDYYATP